MILASQSPRRKKILSEITSDFQVVVSNYEEIMNQNTPPNQLVLELAIGKALEVWKRHPNDTIISADTIVFHNNKRLGKPHNKEKLYEMLLSYSRQTVPTYTGNCIIKENKIICETTTTFIDFGEITKDLVERYYELVPGALGAAGGICVEEDGYSILNSQHRGEWNSTAGISKEFLLQHLES